MRISVRGVVNCFPKSLHDPSYRARTHPAATPPPCGRSHTSNATGTGFSQAQTIKGKTCDHFNQPTAVAVGRRGCAPGEFQTPHGLAVDADENIYVSERMNHRVQVFSPDGRALAPWPDLCRAGAIEVKGAHVYVGTGYDDNAIYRFTRDGRNRETVGGGRDADGYPHGIHVDAAGSIHVADPVAENAAARPAKYLAA